MPTYRRILLKLSGESLMGKNGNTIDSQAILNIVKEIQAVVALQVQIGLVIGGGNIFRGASLAAHGIDRITADNMGMLATIINALALQDAFYQLGVEARVMSAIAVPPRGESYNDRRAIQHLEKGRVVIFAGGTGNPLFTTDSAASLRAIEIGAQLLIKATKVDGVYSADPMLDPNAQRFPRLSYQQVLAQQLGVMDLTAILLCRDHQLPLRVVNMYQSGALARVVSGQDEGTLISGEE
jgi:uridylate kinase